MNTMYCKCATIALSGLLASGMVAAGSTEYDMCVTHEVIHCDSVSKAEKAQCILDGLAYCWETYGGGGGSGGVEPGSDSFTAEQKRQFDALTKGFRSLSEEQARLSRELRDFMRELSRSAQQSECGGEYSD